MNLLVIHELDLDDNEKCVIGVADSIKNAESIIEKFYGKGKYKEISFNDIRDSNLEYSKVIEVNDSIIPNFNYKVKLTLEWFSLNEA
jgi:hypothetical protein